MGAIREFKVKCVYYSENLILEFLKLVHNKKKFTKFKNGEIFKIL